MEQPPNSHYTEKITVGEKIGAGLGTADLEKRKNAENR